MWNSETVEENKHNPVILWWTASFPGTSETRYCSNEIKCDVFSNRNISDLYNVEANLFYASNIKFDDLPLPRRPKEVIWGLYHEESPRNVEEMMHEDVLSLFNYSSTFSRFSDVPFPLQYLNSFEDITNMKYFVPTLEKNKYLNEISPVMYLQSDCETSTERDIYVKELMKYIKIDSYGICLNNKKLPNKFTEDYLNKLHDDEFLHFIARYKFVIAIENGICYDYVTEKFWRAIKVGTVPIYFGSPLIKDWYPNNKSAILLQDYPTPKMMSNYITKMLNDDTLYESYLEHKTKRLVTNAKLLDEIKTRPYQIDALKSATEFECYVCEKLHERRNGKFEQSIVNKNHYDCPKPLSALTLEVNPLNSWAYSFETAKQNAASIRKKIMTVD
ncbi:Alpha-(1,3)-fucosyltransferase 10 [Papilio xuthus]|uniref:Fucosyltransferase n=1 Tax=Papilio xuthus TaxID=66420 RepID=A0A194PIE9_PAPXU|nr:Alpha-(1,3)-fucosyltransferase 10 [Papilio xuthus]